MTGRALDLFGEKEPPPAKDDNARDALWRQGLPILRGIIGGGDKGCRAFLGRLLKEAGDDYAAAFQILVTCQEKRPMDPASWLMEAARARARKGNPAADLARELGVDTDRFLHPWRLPR